MNHLTEEQVLQLAPDAASLKSGKDLSNPKKWLNYTYNERVLWGEMQGSGKDPYRTQIDLISTAFKCSCPSRKFPCKHGLGLMLVFAKNLSLLTQSDDEPAWVKEWIDKRQTKAIAAVTAPKIEETDNKTEAKKAKEKEKRDNNRLDLVQAGAAELELLLKDLLRGGFLSIPEKGTAFFEKTAARMVDAKAPGLANQARGFSKINFYTGNAWHSEVLEQAAETFLLLDSFRNIEKQNPSSQNPDFNRGVQEDIKSLIGWNQKKNELLESENADIVTDNWLVLGRSTEQEDDLTIQKHWLLGEKTGRYALILDFAYKNSAIPTLLVTGTLTQAELVFYPSNMPFRAVIKNQGSNTTQINLSVLPLANFAKMQEAFVEKLSLFPWADELPFFLNQLTLVTHENAWFLKDTEGGLMPMNPKMSFEKILQLLALTGGKPMNMFVLKTQKTVLPIGILSENKYQRC
jgi:hypothetical protein